MAGGIAHDFNNILTAIMGNAELAQAELKGMPGASEYLSEISKASRRARDLVQQILTFSRRREQTRQVIPLDPVIQEAVRLLRATLPVSIDITVDFSTGCPAALADSTQVHQVLMNLCTNAAHAIGLEKGAIRISQSLFTVADAGAAAALGLKPATMLGLTLPTQVPASKNKLWSASSIRSSPPKGREGGPGLGSRVVHGIMQAHEGAVTVESVPGKGTVFSLYFPASAAPASSRPSGSPTAQGAGQRILLIDDEPAIVSLGTKMLRRLGYLATGYDDPVAALAAFRNLVRNSIW